MTKQHKPCPFCGGTDIRPSYDKVFLRCNDCDAAAPADVWDDRYSAGTTRKKAVCPRCHKYIEVEVDSDNSAVCPACENEIYVSQL